MSEETCFDPSSIEPESDFDQDQVESDAFEDRGSGGIRRAARRFAEIMREKRLEREGGESA